VNSAEAEWGGGASSGSGRRFKLLEVVGRGSFGDVYLAEQHSGAGFRRKVVLKVLNEDVARIRGAGRRMRDEARVLGLLSHRHIVAVHDLVKFDDRWAILMDYVPGADLERILEALDAVRGTFPVAAALEVGAAIFDALDFAWNADDGKGGKLAVIHRDIKPSNVRLTADGDMKVLDFGVARFSHEARECETRTTAWIGTERYMSPERLLREGDTQAGDVYATASTVVELILGHPMGRTPIVPERHATYVDEALARIRPRIDAEPHVVARVITALSRALRADPGLRPEAKELSRELEALAKRVRGPGLREFARELVPKVDTLLGSAPVPASGLLIEGTGTSGPGAAEESGTVDPANAAVEASFFEQPADRPRRYGWFSTFLAATAAAACSLGALFVGTAAALGDEVWAWIPMLEISALSADPLAAIPIPSWKGIGLDPEILASPDGRMAEVVASEGAAVTLEGASYLRVTCGGSSVMGAEAVRVVNPGGWCVVEAEWLGDTYRTELVVEPGGRFVCMVERGALGCSR
jgi:eukaryotic-like serine/threonine-protein kinase